MITESKFLQLESLQELMKVQNEEKEMEGLARSGREDGDSGVCLSFCQGRANGCLLSSRCSLLVFGLSDAR